MKKFIITGAIFGAAIVPLSTLGLVLFFAEVLFLPFTLIPRWIITTLADVSGWPGILAIGSLIIVSAIFYAVFGALLFLVYKKFNKWAAIGLITVYYLLSAFFGVASVEYSSKAPGSEGLSPDPVVSYEYNGCENFNPETCPNECVVCPPCPECSSISCRSKDFCAQLGIDRGWYESIKLRQKNINGESEKKVE